MRLSKWHIMLISASAPQAGLGSTPRQPPWRGGHRPHGALSPRDKPSQCIAQESIIILGARIRKFFYGSS